MRTTHEQPLLACIGSQGRVCCLAGPGFARDPAEGAKALGGEVQKFGTDNGGIPVEKVFQRRMEQARLAHMSQRWVPALLVVLNPA